MRILLVDDEPSIKRFIAPLLEKHGHRVDMTVDGTQALAFFAANCPDVIILDLGLPEMDGDEVLKIIRAKNAQVPIIIFSGHSGSDIQKRMRELGANDYIVKPILPPKMIELVEKWGKK